MRITAKGQVTIPQHIRKRFGFLPLQEVEFVEKDGRVWLRLPGKPQGVERIARMRGRASVKMSTEEILALTRGEA